MAKNKDESPSFLSAQPKAKTANKKILMLIVGAIAVMLMVLMIGMSSGKDEKDDYSSAPVEVNDAKPITAPVEGFGLVMPEASKEEVRAEKESLLAKHNIEIVGPPPVDPEEEAKRRERDEIRRRKFERDQQAISSGLVIKRMADGSAAQTEASLNRPEDTQKNYQPGHENAYDPAADQDKEAFFSRADTNQWISPHTREAGRTMEIKTGTMIPGTMVSGINSDLPGNLIAQVTQNVYDTATGRFLLIPQGAKLYGVYDSRVVYGQERVLIAWNRVIFPDGSSVTLGAMPGADISGYAGFTDQVDNHYLRIFGSAILMSLITGGTAYTVDMASNSSSNSNTDNTSLQDEMTAALAAQLGQTTTQLLQKNLNIKPTLEIRPGYQFNVMVTKDVVFRGAYGG